METYGIKKKKQENSVAEQTIGHKSTTNKCRWFDFQHTIGISAIAEAAFSRLFGLRARALKVIGSREPVTGRAFTN